MRLVNLAKDGAVELNWMWLPTFIGQNYLVLKELEKAWRSEFMNAPRNNDTLDAISRFTTKWLCEKFKIPGLDKYLEGLQFVMEGLEQPSEEG